jgi:hypothetical protein
MCFLPSRSCGDRAFGDEPLDFGSWDANTAWAKTDYRYAAGQKPSAQRALLNAKQTRRLWHSQQQTFFGDLSFLLRLRLD